jgi:hypothetical protein
MNLPAPAASPIIPALLYRRRDHSRSAATLPVFLRSRIMLQLRYRSIGLTACGTLLLAAGCQAPLPAGIDASHLETAPRRTSERPSAAKVIETATDAADDATVATVMQEVQQISASNPAAGRMLLDELSRSEPKLWPLVVEQFRSQQAFHDELSARRASTAPKAIAKVADVAATNPPSAEVGRLADPRGVRPDPEIEQAFANATPANMPAPGVRQGDRKTRRQGEADSHVIPASFAEPEGGVELALFNQVSPPAKEGRSLRVDQPADNAATDWQVHLDRAIEDLGARVADGPRSTAEVHQLISLRLLELLAGDTEDALKPIPNVSTEEQDYWSGQIFALATFLDHHRQPDDKRRAAASVTHLDEAVGHLRELGSLSLRNLAFCKNVYGFGAYEPYENPTFSAGQQVTLYLEVENYHSESTKNGYSTQLGASYEVVNETGERIAGGEFPVIEDQCRSRRRDFHIQYGLVLPKTMKPGKHRLQLVMKDRQSDKMGNGSIAFEVRGN